MRQINGRVLLLIAREPLLEWAKSVYDGPMNFSLEDLASEPQAISFPTSRRGPDVEVFLQRHHRDILEHVFREWTANKSLWPPASLELLKQWFKAKLIVSIYEVDEY